MTMTGIDEIKYLTVKSLASHYQCLIANLLLGSVAAQALWQSSQLGLSFVEINSDIDSVAVHNDDFNDPTALMT